ncbi:MAG: ExeA family protein [Candidatus Binatia bacterium]
MYTSFFGFSEKPFNVTPNPHFFYTNQRYDEAYANLLYGIRERKGFMLLTGEVGTGKTTILQRLMQELEATVPFVFFYNTTLTFDDLLTYVCEELSLKVNGQKQLGKIQALNEFLLTQLRTGSTAVLLVDEAQNFQSDVFENLRLLSNLETPREKLLQIILAGQPELEVKLDRAELRQLKQRISVQSRLDCLGEGEVAAFIDHRLAVVGSKRRDVFSQDAVREIAFYSKGIPRMVNIICDNALLIGYADSRRKIAGDIIREVAADLRLDFQPQQAAPKASAVKALRDGRAKNGNGVPVAFEKTVGLTSPSNLPVSVNGESAPPTTQVPPAKPTGDVLKPSFVEALTRALTEAMGPMAPLVIREHLAAMDTSSALSRQSVERLVESVSSEVLDDLMKTRFKTKMVQLTDTLTAK